MGITITMLVVDFNTREGAPVEERQEEGFQDVIWEIKNKMIPIVFTGLAAKDRSAYEYVLRGLIKFRETAQKTYEEALSIVERRGMTTEEYEALQYLVTLAEKAYLVRIHLTTTATAWEEAGDGKSFRAEFKVLQTGTVELEASIQRFHFSTLRLPRSRTLLSKAVND